MLTAYIADDEVWVVLGLKKQLERSSLPVTVLGTANNGVNAKEEIERLKPDIVFTDIRMPGINGLDLLKEINAIDRNIRVVIISGYSDFEYAREALSNHAYNYLVKPIKQEELEETLAKINGELYPEATEESLSIEKEELIASGEDSIDQIIRQIKEDFLDSISLSDYAEEYGMSVGNLSSKLKDRLSMNFSDYVTSLRMQKAKDLLRDESLSIEAVAEQSGYSDYFYFTKVFKKVEGISPSKYRKEI